MKASHLFFILASIMMFQSCSDDTQTSAGCATVVLLSYKQEAHTLILEYDVSSSVAVEASITTGNNNPDNGLFFNVNNSILDFDETGLPPGNYNLYLRAICDDGTKGLWNHLTPIIINESCTETVSLNSYTQSGTVLKLNLQRSNNVGIQACFSGLNYGPNEGTIVSASSGSVNLNLEGIPSDTYHVFLRTLCADGTKGVWTDPYQISIDNYHCLKPYNINYTVSISGSVYIWWWDGNYDYAKWQYAIVLQGEPMTSGTIITIEQPHLPIFPNYPAKDVYVRGVCGENSYTDWLQVW
jgi:hypothetical protein